MSGDLEFDVIIIGAGLYGIQSARTYLEIHPKAKLAILEASEYIGGAWSKERVYDTLWTQDSSTIAEFSDVPLKLKPEDQFLGLFPASHMSEYLEEYARSHKYGEATLEDRIIFNTRVKLVKKVDGIWVITLEGDSKTLRAPKIIDASGITSKPTLPAIPKLETFKGIRMHIKDLAKSNLYQKTDCNCIAVIGGGKSGGDAAYSAAKAGKKVYWIVRKSGNGPCFYAPVYPSPGFKSADEPLLTRFLCFLSSSQFVKNGFFVRLLNQTMIGRFIIRFFWRTIEGDFRKRANYNRPDPKGNGFKNLEPDTPLFWANDNTGVEQRDDFFDTIAEHVKVIREDIAEMDTESIVLADGTRIAVDTILYGTGWQQWPSHYDSDTAASLGLPVPLGPHATIDREKWETLEATAEDTVLARFPILANPPPYFKKEPQMSPYRLYRSIVPINDSSIVFLGRMSVVNGWRVAEAQSLWTVAAMDGKIHEMRPIVEMETDVAETVVWCRRRYLNKGQLANWFLWDCIAYTDQLLDELGLKSHLGKEGVLSPCKAKSLSGLVEEYRTKYGSN
ncbi:hypothetical protein AA313_de0209196 [Arthrobotrys entomopaga]|nr:hypothetical protein AA313_de0209196 [Arthrobotrys entomopaga]